MGFRPTAEVSDLSGSAVEADADPAGFDNHRHAALVLSVFQHLGQFSFVFKDIAVLDVEALFLVGFTSRLGVRSAVLAVNDHPIHNPLLFFSAHLPAVYDLVNQH
jgi:hypothetical protein